MSELMRRSAAMPETTAPGTAAPSAIAIDDPAEIYRGRIAAERAALARARVGHRWLVWIRMVSLLGILFVATGLLPRHLIAWSSGIGAFVVLTIFVHAVEQRLRRRERRIAYYDAGLARIEERWMDAGDRGERFLDPHHLYALDLDLFGRGGLFGLLCTARTEAGKERLAAWLKAPATVAEVSSRQAAVRELAGLLELREAMWECGRRIERDVRTDRLTAWLGGPLHPAGAPVRIAAAVLGLAAVPAIWLVIDGHPIAALAIGAAQAGFAHAHRKLTAAVSASAARRAWELQTVSALVEQLERARFSSPALVELKRALDGHDLRARRRIGRLIRYVEWLEARHNLYFAILTAPFLFATQLALAIEAWRRRHGAVASRWVEAVATVEALSSLATFSFEHPSYAAPHVIADAKRPVFTAEGLGHPLLPAATMITNDVDLGSTQLVLITGSNMSGKSTYLRAVGINAVLALAGGPVCARTLSLSPLSIGATIRTSDSLQEGVSRFFAEVRRLRDVVALAERSPFTLFLLDEILAGTNSHDRQRGGEAIVKTLLDRGAIGLVTTHDLALAQLADSLHPRAVNGHFQDRIDGDRLVFDFTLRPGIVSRSNALDLMRLVGLRV